MGAFRRGTVMGVVAGWIVAQQVWVLWKLSRIDVRRELAVDHNRARRGVTFAAQESTPAAEVTHAIEDGIERIVYLPKRRRFQTPILMQHGMWHGAWCWQTWQELFAEWGWETHAVSLPGHGRSPEQRPIKLCTLDYYLGFLKSAIERTPRRPIVMGHSMGGALTQWYLKYVGDLPAAVLVAPWVSHNAFADAFFRFVRLDALGVVKTSLKWRSAFFESPELMAKALITDGALYSPEELYARLGPESALITYQHNPPFWTPPQGVRTPMLLVAGEKDAVVSLEGLRKSAAFYCADFVVAEGVGHNLMIERTYRQTAETIHTWLSRRQVD